MAKIIIKNLGPIEDIELEIKNINILFGPQASGKSIISRAIYFFENYIDNFIESIIMSDKETSSKEYEGQLLENFRNKFKEFIEEDTFVKYIFDDDIYITIDIKSKLCYFPKLNKILPTLKSALKKEPDNNALFKIAESNVIYARKYLRENLHIKHMQSFFIPDSRNSINLLENYSKIIYIKKDELPLDWTIPLFISDLSIINNKLADGIKKYSRAYLESQIPLLDYCIKLINKILKGEYKKVDNKARIYINDDKYISLDNASSGQREALPILNIIFYLFGGNCNLFIEEPETHLFPEAQMQMMELLAAFVNSGNKVFFTTHSPYLLACANDLMYASNLAKYKPNDRKRASEISKIVDERLWIDYDNLCVNFIENGTAINILDGEDKLIDDEKIDHASDIIMENFNDLFDKVEIFDLRDE